MPRNMSFSMTTDPVRRRSKTVTRRRGWWFLEAGEVVCAVEKGRGLKKGEKVTRICLIRIVSTRFEPLNAITAEEVAREGFPGRSPAWFVAMFCAATGCRAHAPVNRIEFEYLDP